MRRRLEEKDVMHAAMEVELRGKEEAMREEMTRQKVGRGIGSSRVHTIYFITRPAITRYRV